MNNIRSKADVAKVVDRLIETQKWLTLRDEFYGIGDRRNSCVAITRITKDDLDMYHTTYHDDISGDDWTEVTYPCEVESIIWFYRKSINHSGQLADL